MIQLETDWDCIPENCPFPAMPAAPVKVIMEATEDAFILFFFTRSPTFLGNCAMGTGLLLKTVVFADTANDAGI